MIDGILLIDKESGISSYDVIRRVKKVLPKGQKIGHGGTLDPFATGLLIVLLGKATKLMLPLLSLRKKYIVEGILGFSTDTQDITGQIFKRSELVIPDLNDIQRIIREDLTGNISQVPPLFSAKKINGQRAYDIARKGESVELMPKDITVYEFDIVEYEYPNIRCSVVCSSGTYVRTLINDLGAKLDTFATAKDLRRESIGSFHIDDAVSSKDIDENILNNVIDIFKVNEILKDEQR